MEVETDTLVDDIRNTALACYAAWPERVHVIDRGKPHPLLKVRMGPLLLRARELKGVLEKLSLGRT